MLFESKQRRLLIMKQNKNIFGSKTHIFCLIWPWAVVLTLISLDEFGVIDVLKIKNTYVFMTMIIPVLIAVIWFIIKRSYYDD